MALLLLKMEWLDYFLPRKRGMRDFLDSLSIEEISIGFRLLALSMLLWSKHESSIIGGVF